MVLSFVLLIAASVLFRYLAVEVNGAFEKRTRALMPLNVGKRFVRTLFSEHRHQLQAFRAQALPLQGLQMVLNTLACATLLFGIWTCPPGFIKGGDLWLLQRAGSLVVSTAFLADAILFIRMAYTAWSLETASCDAEPEA